MLRITLNAITFALLLCTLPSLSTASDLWRCKGNVFTNRALPDMECEPFTGSRVCGTGLNRYFTPEREGLSQEKEDCTPSAPAASPFVNRAYVGQDKPLNWEKKLQSTLAEPITKKQLANEFDQQVGELRNLMQQLPGGSAVLEQLDK